MIRSVHLCQKLQSSTNIRSVNHVNFTFFFCPAQNLTQDSNAASSSFQIASFDYETTIHLSEASEKIREVKEKLVDHLVRLFDERHAVYSENERSPKSNRPYMIAPLNSIHDIVSDLIVDYILGLKSDSLTHEVLNILSGPTHYARLSDRYYYKSAWSTTAHQRS